MRKRPGTWVLLGIWVTVTVIFGYIFPYTSYRSGGGGFGNDLAPELPAALARTIGDGIPFYGGSLVLILGVMTIGSEFGWSTWKTLLTQRPGRGSVFAAKATALGIATLGFTVAAYAAGAIASVGIAAMEGASMTFPAATDLAGGVLSGWLILAVWAAGGVLLAILTRGTSLAIGIGILWGLAFEGLLAAFASSISWLEWLVDILLRANGYSLVRAVAGASSEGRDGPGAFSGPYVSGAQALAVLAAYLVAFIGLSLWLFRRRDVA
jgi:ABC-type transport system involved in multi-copper enzyme maturation permease subunit